MDNVTTVGIDLAKSVFSLHGVDEAGKVVLRRTVSRAKFVEVVARLPPCLIAMEACGGAGAAAAAGQAGVRLTRGSSAPDPETDLRRRSGSGAGRIVLGAGQAGKGGDSRVLQAGSTRLAS